MYTGAAVLLGEISSFNGYTAGEDDEIKSNIWWMKGGIHSPDLETRQLMRWSLKIMFDDGFWIAFGFKLIIIDFVPSSICTISVFANSLDP